MTNNEQKEFEKKFFDQFMSDRNLFGLGGAFVSMLKNVIFNLISKQFVRRTWTKFVIPDILNCHSFEYLKSQK